MKINWTIVETNDGWCLRCTHVQKHQIHNVCKIMFTRFIDALRAAQTLQVKLSKKPTDKKVVWTCTGQ